MHKNCMYAGKPLYIRRLFDSTLPIVRCESYSRPNFDKQPTVFSMSWYKIVMQHFLVVYHGISHASLVFSRKARVYTEKIQVTSGIFQGIPRESVVCYYSTIAPFYHIRAKERAKYATLLNCRTG